MRRAAVLLLLLGLVLLGQSPPAAAQVSGRVVDSRGRPLPAVAVELWRGGQRTAARSTAADGRFQFAEAEASGPLRLFASALGYATVQRDVSPPVAGLTIELASAAVELEGISAVAAPRLRCPTRDDAAARNLWTAVRNRYDPAQDTLSASFYARRYDGLGTFQTIGRVDESRLGRSWYSVRGMTRRNDVFRRTSFPYGYRILSSFDPAYALWEYRPLHSTESHHFLDVGFGTRHTFSVLARDGANTIVGFCPARASWRGPSIQGTLTVGRDTSLLKAEWTFRARRPDEEAGGEVVFVARGDTLGALLPANSLFWRKILGQKDMYFHRTERFVTYEFLPPNRMPRQPNEWLSGRDP